MNFHELRFAGSCQLMQRAKPGEDVVGKTGGIGCAQNQSQQLCCGQGICAMVRQTVQRPFLSWQITDVAARRIDQLLLLQVAKS
jgi:hypothetical protein